jgi:hypothetical protein
VVGARQRGGPGLKAPGGRLVPPVADLAVPPVATLQPGRLFPAEHGEVEPVLRAVPRRTESIM